MSSVLDAWKVVVAQSQQLLTHAEQGEWDQVESLLSQRSARIAQLVEQNVVPSQADAVRTAIAQVRSADRALESLAQQQRQLALNGLRSEGNANKMKAAYNRAKRGF